MFQTLPGGGATFPSQVISPRRPLHPNKAAPSSSGGVSLSGATAATAMPRSQRRSLLILGIVFAISAGCMYMLFQSFPELSESDKEYIKYPRSIDDAKELGRVLSQYTDTHFPHVVIGYFFIYVFLQAFAIPGSIFLSVLSGFLFPYVLALTLVCLCSACGASACYLLSDLVLGRNVVARWFPERIELWKTRVARYGWTDLLSCLVFLRITPFLPNWFINIASPVIGFPLSIFFLGTFIGVAPPSALAVLSGTQLYELTSATEFLTFKTLSILILVGFMALLPIAFKRLLGNRLQQREGQD